MNVLSLFSGIGGLELGLERAGMTVVGQVEIDPFCRRVLAKHWPEVSRHDDVRTCVEWWLGDPRPTVDLVCGGFPCQPVSSAGQRLAQEDPRWLWPAFNDVVRQLRPRYVLVENVTGLLARGMGDVLGDLADLGYDAEWDRVPAAFVGAPHVRGRIFIAAYANSQQHESGAFENGGEAATSYGRNQSPSSGAAVRPYVADPDGATRGIPTAVFTRTRGAALSRTASTRPGRRGSADNWWATEPDVGRVAHGVPARVDRLRALGNAVVPQVAEHIGRLILAVDAERGAAA
jgi:DNA (cytosine-5)-methyltransferase 1